MEYKKCETCGVWAFDDRHKCPPKWEVCWPDYDGGEWSTIYAHDSESAVIKAAELLDDEYSLLNSVAEFRVRPEGSDEYETYFCGGEAEVAYSASIQGE